jgi:hypothetical protein
MAEQLDAEMLKNLDLLMDYEVLDEEQNWDVVEKIHEDSVETSDLDDEKESTGEKK